MEVTFQASLYPISQNDFRQPINGFIGNLKADRLKVEVHETSTIGTGDVDKAFDALKRAYINACKSGPTVMVLTLVNEHPSEKELKELNK